MWAELHSRRRALQTALTDSLRLPCGAVLSNRIAKSAITEGLADARGYPTPNLERLYSGWADGGFGLIITGNVIVDRDHLERPGNVIIDGEPSARRAALVGRVRQIRRRSFLGAAVAFRSSNPEGAERSSKIAIGDQGGFARRPVWPAECDERR